MSKTYSFLLRWLPKPVANVVLVVWYILLMLLVIEFSRMPFDGFIYWGN